MMKRVHFIKKCSDHACIQKSKVLLNYINKHDIILIKQFIISIKILIVEKIRQYVFVRKINCVIRLK